MKWQSEGWMTIWGNGSSRQISLLAASVWTRLGVNGGQDGGLAGATGRGEGYSQWGGDFTREGAREGLGGGHDG